MRNFLWCYYLARLVAGTGDLGQDSPIQTSARLIRCLLHGKTRKQRNKNINNFICFPARAQAFSWLSSVTGLQSYQDKNNCSKSSFVQTSQWMKTKLFTQAQWKSLWLKQQFMKSGQKCNCIEVMPVCALIAQRSVLIQSCDLAIFDWSSQKTLMLNVQPNYIL